MHVYLGRYINAWWLVELSVVPAVIQSVPQKRPLHYPEIWSKTARQDDVNWAPRQDATGLCSVREGYDMDVRGILWVCLGYPRTRDLYSLGLCSKDQIIREYIWGVKVQGLGFGRVVFVPSASYNRPHCHGLPLAPPAPIIL